MSTKGRVPSHLFFLQKRFLKNVLLMYFLALRGVDGDQGGFFTFLDLSELHFLTGKVRELDQVRVRFIHPKI